MKQKYATFTDPAQDDLLSSHLAQRLQLFLAPLTRQLHSKLDARLLCALLSRPLLPLSASENATRLSCSAS